MRICVLCVCVCVYWAKYFSVDHGQDIWVTSLEIASLLCNVYGIPTECKTQHHMLGARLGILGPVLSMVYVGEWALWGVSRG